MNILHEPQNSTFKLNLDGYLAYVTYLVKDKKLDIDHTLVPQQIGGRGVASQLVKATYDYAIEQGLYPTASCSYAIAWLKRYPEYQNK